MNNFSITFLGTGNLATAIIQGLLKNGFPPEQITATHYDEKKIQLLKKLMPTVRLTTDQPAAIEQADVVVLCVKPQGMESLLTQVKQSILSRNPLIISIAAGLTLSYFESRLSAELPIIRSMPNTPCQVRMGVTGLLANKHVNEGQREQATNIFNAVGEAFWVEDEHQLDVVTATSAGGPAYFFYWIEALTEATIKQGMPPHQAETLMKLTAKGASQMAAAYPGPVKDLREQVTSKGGTTLAALEVMSNQGITKTVEEAITAAVNRAKALAKS